MAPEVPLFVVGYPLSIAMLTRWVPIVREQRARWLVAHHVGVVCIVAGWAAKGDPAAIAVNSVWLASSTAWYVIGGRRAAAT